MSSPQRALRVYLDTSVFGGVFDEGFETASRLVFDRINTGSYIAMLGATTLAELANAPQHVQSVLGSLPKTGLVLCPITASVEELRDAYIHAKVLGEASIDDATHVATATVHDADVIVSWNFKHIVNLLRIRGFNAVNATRNYRSMHIVSPLEMQYADHS